MTALELIQQGSTKVRNSSDLMLLYIDLFQETFGRKPNCAGCTFSNDWRKLEVAVKKQNNIKIPMKTTITGKYKLNSNAPTILSYIKNNRTYRLYSSRITDEYAKEFLANGTPEELEYRKSLFSIIDGEKAGVSKKENIVTEQDNPIEEKKNQDEDSKPKSKKGRKPKNK